MKLLALLALCGLAAASIDSRKWAAEDSFRPRHHYTFQFDGQVTAGLPIPSSQNAATRVQTNVHMQVVSDRQAVIQLEKIRFATVQREMEPRQLLPFEELEEIRIEKEHHNILSLPVSFGYKHGMVSEIEFSPEEQVWSANIKRAVLNMLQVNMMKKDSVHQTKLSESMKDSFHTVERTIEGECEVTYTMIEMPEQKMQWTKSVNFEKCTSRPEIRYGRRFAEQCEECEKTMSTEKMSSSVATYTLVGTPESFLIEEVELHALYNFAPISDKQQLLTSVVLNKLVLVASNEIEKKIKEVRGDRKETLVYNHEMELAEERFAMTGEKKHLSKLPKWEGKVVKVQELYIQIAKDIQSEVELETVHSVAHIVQIVRLCSEEELKEINRFVFEKNEFEQKVADKIRTIHHDVLALAGTKLTVSALVERIEKKHVQPIKAAQLLKSLVEIRTPSEQIAEELLRLCESNVVSRNPLLQQSCWLTYGAVLNGFCGQNNEQYAIELENEKMCPRELKQKLVRKLVEKLNRAETRYEKVLMLKTISNAAIDVSVVELEKVIRDNKNERVVRMQAIDCLRKLRMPRKIQSVLLPIYMNRNEAHEIRMASLHQIVRSQPEQPIVDQIIFSMEMERSQQIRAFTYSTLKTISESTNPCEEKTASIVAKALQTVPELQTKLLESFSKSMHYFSEEFKTGASLNWASIFTNESVLPKEIMASMDTILGGEWNKYFAQIGLYQHNIDTILNQVARKLETSGIEDLIIRGKRSSSIRPSELLQSLFAKLRINRREVNKEEPHALLYFRYKDMDYAFLPVDMDTLPEMIKKVVREGRIELSEIESFLARGTHFSNSVAAFMYEDTRKIPTALGMSVVLTSKMPTVADVNGHIKFEMEPKNGKSIHGLRLRLVAQPKVASSNVIRMEIACPVVMSGVKMIHSAKLNLPIDAEIEVNWEKKFFIKTTIKNLETEKHILHIHSRPVTFVRVWDKEVRYFSEAEEQTIVLRESVFPTHEINREYFSESGVKMTVSGSIRRPFLTTESELPKSAFVGENVIDIVCEPTTDAPREFVIRMDAEIFEPTQMEKPELDRFFEKRQSEKDLFETEDGESEEDETERRESFRQYSKNVNIEKGYKHIFTFKVETVGDRKTRMMQSTVRTECDEKLRFCRLNFEARRSPTFEESREWELKAMIQTLYPEMPKSVKAFSEQKHREFQGTVEALWGSSKKNSLNLRIQGEQSAEQKQWMVIVKREQKLSEQQKLNEAYKLNQYKISADYELTPEMKHYVNQLYSVVKTWNMWNTESRLVNNEEGRVEMKLRIEPMSRRSFNLTVETPKERVVLFNVQMPVRLPTLNIREQTLAPRNLKNTFERIVKDQRDVCIVKSKEVQTFDKVLFKAPMTPCYTVLAKDCSSEEPEFAVLMRKVVKNSEEKKIKILNRENVFEVEMRDEELIVMINGKKVEKDSELERHGINKVNEESVEIDIDDVVVTFDGYQAKLRLSPLYKNKQCGLCGHYDGEMENEFRRADNEDTTDIQEFHRSFLSEDEECKMDEAELREQKNYKRMDDYEMYTEESEESEEDKDYSVPELKTRILERGQNVCFSVEPLMECVRGSRQTEETVEKTATFKCLRRSHPDAQRLIQSARKNILRESQLEEIEEVYSKKVEMPKSCLAY